ncbi:MAG: hypothetical protein NVS2B9_21970 [Myxococcales bacterium]
MILLDPAGRRAPRLLRAGAIARSELAAALGIAVEVGPGPAAAGATPAPAASPGMAARHYAPAGIVRLVPAAGLDEAAAELAREGQVVGALVIGGAEEAPAGSVGPRGPAHVLRLPADAAGYARGLYAALRALEERGCGAIVLQEVPRDPAWDAVADRLARASTTA